MKAKIFTIVSTILLIMLAGGALLWSWLSSEKPESTTDDYVFSISVPNNTPEALPKRGYAVSSSSDIATEIGMSVLNAGGNAMDAAVAVSYTLSVVEPYASGLGGSGGLLVYKTDTEECVFYDYRAASGSNESRIAVPGFVAGMDAAYKDYGSLPLSDLLNPALYYAENGFTINEQIGRRLVVARDDLIGYKELHNDNGNGSYLSTGNVMYQPELAEVIRAIQTEGADVFYNGWIADDIAAATPLTKEDLASYKVYKREAVRGYFEGYTVYSANAPLSGVTLIQMLEMADELDIVDPDVDLNKYINQLKQITATAYGNRYSTIGDHDFYDFDEQELVSRDYIVELLAEGYDQLDYDPDVEGAETTGFTIVDSDGMVVSSTNTLTMFWGSRKLVDGIFMNSTNDNFSPSGINKFEPGKRSRTYTAPTIITGDDGFVMAIVTPGGNNIPSRLFNVIVDILKFGKDPQASVNKTAILYRNGILTFEQASSANTQWIDTTSVDESFVWKSDDTWWGSVSIAGYTDGNTAFSAYDARRGATKAGLYNPE